MSHEPSATEKSFINVEASFGLETIEKLRPITMAAHERAHSLFALDSGV
jgi:hypothetical protein